MDIEFSTGYIGIFTLMTIILLFGLIYFVVGIFSNKKMLLQGGIIIAFCIIEFLLNGVIIDLQKQKTYDVAVNIIKAIEQYQVANGRYPNQIEDVTPVFIDNIPKTSMGWLDRPFNYATRGDSYRLSFDFYAFLTCTYYPKSISWYCAD